MNATLQQIERDISKRQQAALAEFWKAAHGVASGEAPNAERIERVASAAGKSISDFSNAVATIERRRALRARVDAAAGLEAEEAKLYQQIQAARAKLEAAELEHRRTVLPIGDRLQVIKDERGEAEQAKAELWRECPYPDLSERLQAIERESLDLLRKRSALGGVIRDREEWIVGAKLQAREDEPGPYGRDRADVLANIERREKANQQARDQIADLTKQIEALEQQDRQVRFGEMLVP